MRANGSGDYADWVAAPAAPAALSQAFAAYLAPGDRNAATLVARIDEVSLGAAGSRPDEPAGDATDGIQGEGIVLGPGGRQIAAYPLYSAVGAESI